MACTVSLQEIANFPREPIDALEDEYDARLFIERPPSLHAYVHLYPERDQWPFQSQLAHSKCLPAAPCDMFAFGGDAECVVANTPMAMPHPIKTVGDNSPQDAQDNGNADSEAHACSAQQGERENDDVPAAFTAYSYSVNVVTSHEQSAAPSISDKVNPAPNAAFLNPPNAALFNSPNAASLNPPDNALFNPAARAQLQTKVQNDKQRRSSRSVKEQKRFMDTDLSVIPTVQSRVKNDKKRLPSAEAIVIPERKEKQKQTDSKADSKADSNAENEREAVDKSGNVRVCEKGEMRPQRKKRARFDVNQTNQYVKQEINRSRGRLPADKSDDDDDDGDYGSEAIAKRRKRNRLARLAGPPVVRPVISRLQNKDPRARPFAFVQWANVSTASTANVRVAPMANVSAASTANVRLTSTANVSAAADSAAPPISTFVRHSPKKSPIFGRIHLVRDMEDRLFIVVADLRPLWIYLSSSRTMLIANLDPEKGHVFRMPVFRVRGVQPGCLVVSREGLDKLCGTVFLNAKPSRSEFDLTTVHRAHIAHSVYSAFYPPLVQVHDDIPGIAPRAVQADATDTVLKRMFAPDIWCCAHERRLFLCADCKKDCPLD